MKLYLKDERPLIYLSGIGSSNDNELDLFKHGCKYRCYSYAYTCPGSFYYNKRMEEALETSLNSGVRVMMDSSAHSFHKLSIQGLRKNTGKWNVKDTEKLKEMVVKQYVGYVKDKGKKWDWYVNFDYVRHAPTVYEMQKELEHRGIKPVPVFHGDDGLKWLERYCKEGYKLVGIGSVTGRSSFESKRRYYDHVFNMLEKHGVLAHGFAMTGLSLMFMYPWYSVDSATWAKVAAFGAILYINKERGIMGELHLTDKTVRGKTRYALLSNDMKRDVKRHVEEMGFNIDELRTDGRARSLYNTHLFCNNVMQLKELIKANSTRWKSLL